MLLGPNQIDPMMLDPLVDYDLAYELRVPPHEFKVFGVGDNETEKGLFVFDEKSAESVMAVWAQRKIDLAIDYEHQSVSDPPIEAPNAATRWVPQIRNGELWATEVKWTDRAASYLRMGEYRYFSPCFEFDPDTRRVTKIINIALTNNPAMRGIRPLVAASARKGTADMEEELKKLKAEVERLTAELSTRDARIAELTAAGATRTEEQKEEIDAAAEVVQVLSLPAGARARARASAVKDVASFRAGVLAITGVKTDGSALGVLTAWKDSHETVVKLTARVEELEQEKLKREFELLLDEAGGKDAKLPPSKREEITQIALKSANGKFTAGAIETARAFLSMRGPLVDNTGTKKPETKAGEGEMHPLHLEIRRTLGRDDTPVKQ